MVDRNIQNLKSGFIPPECSRVVNAEKICDEGTTMEFEASPAERSALARRLGLLELKSFQARVTLVRIRKSQDEETINLAASLEADVVQECVVTLDPVENHLTSEFTLMFVPADGRRDRQAPTNDVPTNDGDAFPPDDADLPEPMYENRIDVGEVLSEHLALAVDPYPRKPGATLEDLAEVIKGKATIGVPPAEGDKSPFSALQRLTRGSQANT